MNTKKMFEKPLQFFKEKKQDSLKKNASASIFREDFFDTLKKSFEQLSDEEILAVRSCYISYWLNDDYVLFRSPEIKFSAYTDNDCLYVEKDIDEKIFGNVFVIKDEIQKFLTDIDKELSGKVIITTDLFYHNDSGNFVFNEEDEDIIDVTITLHVILP